MSFEWGEALRTFQPTIVAVIFVAGYWLMQRGLIHAGKGDALTVIRGAVRPDVTKWLVLLFAYLCVIQKPDDSMEALKTAGLVLGPVLGFWFGQRTMQKGEAGQRHETS